LEIPPLLEPFCRFCLALNPRRIVLSHLEEYGRDTDDFWGTDHMKKVVLCLKGIAPDIQAFPVYMGSQIGL
jgi:hypothetical protein